MKLNCFCTSLYISCILFSAVSCGTSPTVDLFEIHDVYPKIIEPGDTLVIEGEGFIEGKAEIVLQGTVKPIGLRPKRPIRFKMQGSAISENKIEIPMTAYLMDALTKEAVQFNGTTEVSFPSKMTESALSLSAKSPQTRLELRPAGGGVRIHALKIREAQQLMQQLGIVLDTHVVDDVITIQRVAPDSFAASHQLTAGTKLISVDGFPLFGVEELAGLDLRAPHQFEFVFPEGISKRVTVDMTAGTFKNDEFVAIVLTSIAMGLFLAFVLPSYIKRTAIPKKLPDNPISYILGYTAAAILTVILPAVVIQWQMNILGTIVLAAIFLICTAILLFYSAHPLIIRVVGALGSICTIAAVLLIGGAAGNTLGLMDVVSSQANPHFAFHVWKNPLMMLTTLMAISLLWPKSLLERTNPLTNVAAWLMSICGAMAVVFFCLGGWLIPGLFEQTVFTSPLPMLAAVFIFVVKTWLVLLAARTLVSASKDDRRKNPIGSNVVQLRWIPMLILAGGAVLLEMSPLPDDMQFAGQVISTGVFFTLFSLLLFTQMSFFHRRGASV